MGGGGLATRDTEPYIYACNYTHAAHVFIILIYLRRIRHLDGYATSVFMQMQSNEGFIYLSPHSIKIKSQYCSNMLQLFARHPYVE